MLLTTLNPKPSREEDHKLNALPPAPLAQLLQRSGEREADLDHRAAAITAIEHLAYFQSNRQALPILQPSPSSSPHLCCHNHLAIVLFCPCMCSQAKHIEPRCGFSSL